MTTYESVIKINTNQIMLNLWTKLLFIIILLTPSVYGENLIDNNQRSKEANCLIQGYHSCLLNSLSSLNDTNSTKISRDNNGAVDCFRLSKLASTESQNRSCSLDECPWDGMCPKMGLYNENDGLHTTEDLPISTFYEDVHTIAISFPRYLDSTVLYVLEARPIIPDKNIQQQTPFKFAGVSNQTTISYRVLNICNRYEFRPTVILSNGTVITFLPKTTNSNPPDFLVDYIRIASLRYDTTKHAAIATLVWKHPYGYTNLDVQKYGSYLHTLECDAPSELLNEQLTDQIVKTDGGGTLTATFPEPMIERKCQFRFMVWAISICGNRTLTEAKMDLTLNCTTVQGYRCPAAEMRPHCFSRIDTKLLNSSHSESNISLNVSWAPFGDTKPQYYHVRWGPARSLDLRHKHINNQQSNSESSEEVSRDHHNHQRRTFTNNRLNRLNSRSNSVENLRRPRMAQEFNIWILQADLVQQEKVSTETPYTILSNVSLNAPYGIQVCAIFNGDFKRPDWPKVATNGFTCVCAEKACSTPTTIQCHQSNSKSSSSQSTTTLLPTIRPPLAMSYGVPQPPDIIESISNFTQTLISTQSDGVHLKLTWYPPKNLLQEHISNYDVSIETLLPCQRAPVCCDYVEYTEIDQSQSNHTGVAELFLPEKILHSQCEFIAKITTTAMNGASSVSLRNIQIPQINGHVQHSRDNPTGRKSNSTEDITPNDAPSENCITQFGCYFDLCDENGCLCPDGYNKSLDGLSCVTNTALGAAILNGEPDKSLFNYCQAFGCKSSCTPSGECVCPNNSSRTLEKEPKLCSSRSTNYWNDTTLTIICATPHDKIFSYHKEKLTHLYWSRNSSVLSPFLSNSQVLIRIGAVRKNIDNGPTKLNDAMVIAEILATNSIDLSPFKKGPTDQIGIQFCIINAFEWTKNTSQMHWDLVPIIRLPNLISSSSYQENATLEHAFHESYQNSKGNIIAMAILIPLVCIIILCSLLGLVCYFYPTSIRSVITNRFRRRQNENVENNAVGHPNGVIPNKEKMTFNMKLNSERPENGNKNKSLN